MREVLKDFMEYLPSKEKEEFKVFPNFYEIELNRTRRNLVKSLYELEERLHPQFLFTFGRAGTLNEVKWLIKNKNNFEKNGEKGQNSSYLAYRHRLRSLGNTFSRLLFGEFSDEPYEGPLVYNIVASAFKRMGVESYVINEEERRVYLDLSSLGLGVHAYKFVPWSSGINKELGKVLSEYYMEDELFVDIGLKICVFGSISTDI